MINRAEIGIVYKELDTDIYVQYTSLQDFLTKNNTESPELDLSLPFVTLFYKGSKMTPNRVNTLGDLITYVIRDLKDKKQSYFNSRVIEEMVNNFSFDPKGICKHMENEHRTLQQTFTGMCAEWIKTCASDDYRFDGRNEASHKLAQQMMKDVEDGYVRLPLV